MHSPSPQLLRSLLSALAVELDDPQPTAVVDDALALLWLCLFVIAVGVWLVGVAS